MTKRVLIIFALFCFSWALTAQNSGDDPILFSVDGVPVHISEFDYIYSKTNGDKADFSRASLEEYLDLYTKFKLKVKRAKDMQLDTIPALQNELAGYRRQLADSYLIDREVTEKLTKEAYDRMQEDVDLSHIMVMVEDKASPEDTLKAYKKILEAKTKLAEGGAFANVARTYSEDKSVTRNEGRIGYVTALFPNGMYNLETAGFSLPKGGEVHGPIRTKTAYHLVKIHNRRPARGEAEIAHILIRNDVAGDAIKARVKVDSLYKLLQAGGNYDEIARKHSHDKISAPKAGYIGFFGINRYEQSFENTAFSLKVDEYSKPVQTSIGWHILKLISKKGGEEFSMAKARIQNLVKKDARYEMAKEVMVERIKKDGKFTEFNTTLQTFIDSLDQEFLTYKWKASEEKPDDILFAFGGEMQVSLAEFEDYLQKSSRKRLRMGRSTPVKDAVMDLYGEFTDNQALKYEERQLEKKYPEFKSLMREYEEGILLFEATKMLVWDKASQDSAGLKTFFKTVDGNYKWKKRSRVSQYSLKENAKHLHNQIREFAKTHNSQETMAHFNVDEVPILTFKEKTIEEGRNEILDKMTWEIGGLSASEISKRDKSYNFFKIEEILSPADKSLNDARGYVVADYQDFLEAKWIETLRKDYKIDINQAVFEALIK